MVRPRQRRAFPQVESLESKSLLSAAAIGGVLNQQTGAIGDGVSVVQRLRFSERGRRDVLDLTGREAGERFRVTYTLATRRGKVSDVASRESLIDLFARQAEARLGGGNPSTAGATAATGVSVRNVRANASSYSATFVSGDLKVRQSVKVRLLNGSGTPSAGVAADAIREAATRLQNHVARDGALASSNDPFSLTVERILNRRPSASAESVPFGYGDGVISRTHPASAVRSGELRFGGTPNQSSESSSVIGGATVGGVLGAGATGGTGTGTSTDAGGIGTGTGGVSGTIGGGTGQGTLGGSLPTGTGSSPSPIGVTGGLGGTGPIGTGATGGVITGPGGTLNSGGTPIVGPGGVVTGTDNPTGGGTGVGTGSTTDTGTTLGTNPAPGTADGGTTPGSTGSGGPFVGPLPLGGGTGTGIGTGTGTALGGV